MKIRKHVLGIMLVLIGQAMGQGEPAFGQGRQLESDGKIPEAFAAYADFVEGMYLAANLLVHHPDACRPVLEGLPEGIQGRLLRADEAIRRGARAEALELLREEAAAWRAASSGFETNLSQFAYPVEIANDNPAYGYPADSFGAGPGSQKDNWLIRRFVSLEAWDDAESEFARVWGYHQCLAGQESERGYDGLGLAFALDYAYFLKTYANQPGKSQEVLSNVLLAMDMDLNPYVAKAVQARKHRYRYLFREYTAGLTRQEFIRIVAGAANEEGWLGKLERRLEQRIADGDNAMRRVMAQIRRHQGQTAEALALELAYLDTAKFEPFVDQYRRGCLFHGYERNEEAAEAFGKMLSMEVPVQVDGLADPDEVAVQRMQRSSRAVPLNMWLRAEPRKAMADAQDRMEKILRALGDGEQLVKWSMSRLENDPEKLADVDGLERLKEACRREGLEEVFNTWIERMAQIHVAGNAAIGINLFLGRYDIAANGVLPIYEKDPSIHQVIKLVNRFESRDDEAVEVLLRTMASARPVDPYVHLMLLERMELSDAERICALETVLVPGTSERLFPSGKGFYYRNRIRNIYELAYQLMRLYETIGAREKLVDLGMKVLNGEAPFSRKDPLTTVRPNSHERQVSEDVLDCTWVMLAHVGTDAEREALESAVERNDCEQLRRQVARVLGNADEPEETNGPIVVSPREAEDLFLLSNRDDVRAISADGRWIGTSWGVVGYGNEQILEYPLGVRVQCILKAGEEVYLLGTENGFFRLEGHPDRGISSFVQIGLPHESWRENRREEISVIVPWGGDGSYWLAGNTGIWHVQFASQSEDAPWAEYYGRIDKNLFLHEGRLCSDQGIYDAEEDRFVPVTLELPWMPLLDGATNFEQIVSFGRIVREGSPGRSRSIRLIGSSGGVLRADVYALGTDEHRLAIVDVQTGIAHQSLEMAGVREGNSDDLMDQILQPEGGLYRVDPVTLGWKRIDSGGRQLTDFYVNNLRIDSERELLYVCTRGGLTILSLTEGFPIVGTVTVLDGLPSNSVEDVVRDGDRLYIRTCLDKDRGGLAVQDLKTKLVQVYHESDGEECDKMRRLRLVGNDLRPAEVRNKKNAACSSEPLQAILGERSVHVHWEDWAITGQTHGLVIARGSADSHIVPIPQVVALTPLKESSWNDEEAKGIEIHSPEELAEAMKSPNSAVRAEALVRNGGIWERKQMGDYLPLYATALQDPKKRVRDSAMWCLVQMLRAGDMDVLPVVRAALEHSDGHIRDYAQQELYRAGEPTSPGFFLKIAAINRNSEFFCGANSSSGTEVSRDLAWCLLAERMTTLEEFACFFAFPDGNYREQLGGLLREHPEWLHHLLTLQAEKKLNNYLVEYARDVMGYAGTILLPGLHEALVSDDRVIRSNAALGCGAIGDAESIPHVLAALERESGLSRASCVWALGELKAKEAIPRLSAIFAEAVADEMAARQGNFGAQQRVVVAEAQYDSLANFNRVADSFSSVSQPASKEELERREVLLKPRDVLKALEKIGPEYAQPFYRNLAGDPYYQWRQEAAVRLGDAKGNDWEQAIPVLRNLLMDRSPNVELHAAVSLVQLGQEEGVLAVLDAFGGSRERKPVLQPLKRLDDASLDLLLSKIETLTDGNPQNEGIRSYINNIRSKKQG